MTLQKLCHKPSQVREFTGLTTPEFLEFAAVHSPIWRDQRANLPAKKRRFAAALAIVGLPITCSVVVANEAGADINCPEGRSPGWVDSSTAEGEPIRVYGCVRDSVPVNTTPPNTTPAPATTPKPSIEVISGTTPKNPTESKTPRATVAPTTTENLDKDGNGRNDREEEQESFISLVISDLASKAEAAEGYPVYNISAISPDVIGQIRRGEQTVEAVMAAYMNPAPTTTAAETTTTTAVLLTESPGDGSNVELAAGNTTEVVESGEDNSQTREVMAVGLALIITLAGSVALNRHLKLRGRDRSGRN